MGEEVKIEIIRTTQSSLSKYIKKPPLTEKLLRKPPFRYLHDITTTVMKETGYLQGLYSQDELNPENIKDREAKIAFLEKLIAAVNLSTGISILARPNKIVAGLDVAKTNELLQAIGKALDKKIDSSKAVEQVLNKKSKGSSQQKKDGPKDKVIKETKTSDSKPKETRNSDTLKKKSKEKIKSVGKPESRKSKQSSKDVSPPKETPANNNESPKERIKPDEDKSEVPTTVTVGEESSDVETRQLHNPEPKHDVKPPPPSPAVGLDNSGNSEDKEESKEKKSKEKFNTKTKDLDTSKDPLKSQDLHSIVISNDLTDITKSCEEPKRPQSARAVHRKKSTKKPISTEPFNSQDDKKEEVSSLEKVISGPKELSALEKKPLEQETPQSTNVAAVARETKRPRTAARPASARPGAPRVRDRGMVQLNDTDNKQVNEPVNLIVDSIDLPKDDDESLVIVEAPSSEGVVDQVVGENQLLSGDQGHLVSQILETQKELEENVNFETGLDYIQKVDISWSSARQEAVAREVDKLRSAIQALTRAVNPLGKLIDFLQEDVDSMQTELETWVTTNQQLAQQLQAEQRMTEECIEPLTRRLEDMQQLVEEQQEEMSVVKGNILRNDERISKLLKARAPTH
ncbi:TRAF3-interacting protein 1-like isoform X2 [Macrosteles quadrilineatus]|uniref:TRAF3-interacting protein 1-like isoform X2 n=1 Tax=Macrosteles quadrilineatus TaxID=74068 RepID=UPI0023E0DC8F|nr:TRAF3-interacting protein 1-like isoform X2 [Macrosteles quadrilineatus]